MRMRVWTWAVAVAAVAGTVAQAQDEELSLGTVKTKHPTVLLASPKNGSTALNRIPAGTEMKWVSGQKKGNFLRVVGDRGPIGWVPARDVETLENVPPTAEHALQATSTACAANLKACPAIGCGTAGTTQAVVNEAKRRPPASGPALLLTFADFSALQQQADHLVGQAKELTAAERATLKDMTVSSGTVSEGGLVRVTAFIGLGAAPHANSGESVNCRLKGAANNDFHINIAENGTDNEFDGVVVEMIPQDRPAAWTTAKLGTLQTQRRRILMEGNLFYDNKHVVNSDKENSVGGQPPRFSLWEIHRITRFWVCQKAGGACDPATESEWTELK
jgi:hypothetical protein